MKHLVKTGILLLSSALAACSSVNSVEDINYRHSEITPTLEVPPDLISRSSDRNLALPGSKVGTEENTGRYVETGNLNIEPRTLPLIDGIKIEGQGDLVWLKVSETAEKVYPLVRNFWFDQGFRLLLDEPAIGMMKTEWLESRYGNDSQSFLASILESMRAADFKDQYSTRVERSDDNQSTRIYISHRGQEFFIHDQESVNANLGRNKGWQMSPSNADKEYEMISRLMISLGAQKLAVKDEIEKLDLLSAQANMEYDEESEEFYLKVRSGFEQTWNRLVHQLDRLDIEIMDSQKDDNDGVLLINSKHLPQNLKQSDEYAEQVKIALTGSRQAAVTRIEILNPQGAISKSEEAKSVLQFVQQQLN